MSATNRGAVRRESDFYATPLETVYSFLDTYDGIKSTDVILEPSAGNGNIIQAMRNRGYKNHIDAVEIRREEYDALRLLADGVTIGDFLELRPLEGLRPYNVVIGNPPFSKALEFVEKSLELVDENGRVIMLLRTAFLESKSRFNFWKKNPLSGLYTLHKRPSFTGKGTDADSYSWFVWCKSDVGQTIKII